MIPALLISTSTAPSFSSASAMKRSNDSASVTSRAKPSAPLTDAAAFWDSPRSRSPMATFMPLAEQARAVARPIPRAAPVMATTFPRSWRGSFLAKACS